MAALSAVVAVLAVSLVLNLSRGDTQLETRLAPLYAVADPQFKRAMGTLLGSALVPGNRVQELLNGAEAFPVMLGAIGAAQRTITDVARSRRISLEEWRNRPWLDTARGLRRLAP